MIALISFPNFRGEIHIVCKIRDSHLEGLVEMHLFIFLIAFCYLHFAFFDERCYVVTSVKWIYLKQFLTTLVKLFTEDVSLIRKKVCEVSSR